MLFGQNASHGWLSTLSRSWEIPPTIRPSTCSTVVGDCDWIRIEQSDVLQTWLESDTNASGSGCSLALRRNRATIGAMAIWCRSHDQLLRKARVLLVQRFPAGRMQANRSFLDRGLPGSYTTQG